MKGFGGKAKYILPVSGLMGAHKHKIPEKTYTFLFT